MISSSLILAQLAISTDALSMKPIDPPLVLKKNEIDPDSLWTEGDVFCVKAVQSVTILLSDRVQLWKFLLSMMNCNDDQ